VIGTPLGLLGLAILPIAWVRVALGVLVLIATGVTWRPIAPRGPPRRRWGWLAGVCSGLGNGLAAMSGPPAIVYFLAAQTERETMRSSLMAYFPLTSALALPLAWWGGLIGVPSLLIAAFGMPLMLAGGWIGTSLFRRHGAASYRPIALIALGLTALAALTRGILGLL
jgi:hypothetical protein